MRSLVCRLLLVLLSFSAFAAQTNPDPSRQGKADAGSSIPRFIGRVNDYAGVLTSQQSAVLEERLAKYEAETTHQIVVLTVPSLDGIAIESLSLRVANAWKIGSKGVNNGVLVTVVTKDRKTRIEVGRGLSQYVPADVAAKIINDTMVPAFRAGSFAAGIERGIDRLMAECRKLKVAH